MREFAQVKLCHPCSIQQSTEARSFPIGIGIAAERTSDRKASSQTLD
jgi:hypothetical protein